MRPSIILQILITCCITPALSAQTLEGTWQGATGTQQRVLVITEKNGTRSGQFYNLGSDATANPVSSVTIYGQNVKFALDNNPVGFDGVLSADGNTIVGQWQSGAGPQPLTLQRAIKDTAWVIDASPHKATRVKVAGAVELEVLDWGGKGTSLVFLAGMGNSAHIFDAFAPKFTDKHRVIGITRRGYGVSSMPPPTDENYDADRLGDDVLAVIAALNLEKPVLVGHSIAGQELSSVATRHPTKIAGLIYLEAAYAYAFYIPHRTTDTYTVAGATIRRSLRELTGASPSRMRALIQEIEETIPQLQKSLNFVSGLIEGLPDGPPAARSKQFQVSQAIFQNQRKYAGIKTPTLVVMGTPPQCEPNCESQSSRAMADAVVAQVDAVDAEMPSARVVRIPHAAHYIFRSNEADVVSEMNAFLLKLNEAKP